jgi:hypothetical protein
LRIGVNDRAIPPMGTPIPVTPKPSSSSWDSP